MKYDSDVEMDNGRKGGKKRSKSKLKLIILLVVFLILVAILGTYIYKEKFAGKESTIGKEIEKEQIKEPEPEPEVQIFKGDSRPIAVMIDNEPGAWPQAGIQEAYMVYEIIVEGGQTRMMALFKGVDTAKIGPTRSSRHYFVEYAMEHSAIYTHFGWSPQAEQTIMNNGVNNINGIYYDGTTFWREGYGYHTAFTSIAKIEERAKDLNYLTVSGSDSIYKYSAREYILKNGKDVTGIKMVYSTSHNTSYEYDEAKKIFLRSQRGAAHTDRVTKQQYYAKNIIVISAKNYTLNDSSGKGRQELVNEGNGTGYYLTNGKCIEITWKKDNINSKTQICDLEGKEITLNDGITFFQVVPEGEQITVNYKNVETAT